MPRKTSRKIQAARARFRAWIFLSSREQVTYTSVYRIFAPYITQLVFHIHISAVIKPIY
jgi:hypothetical protein